MGQYKLAFYWNAQIGFLISYMKGIKQICIDLPFITITIGLEEYARGVNFFKK